MLTVGQLISFLLVNIKGMRERCMCQLKKPLFFIITSATSVNIRENLRDSYDRSLAAKVIHLTDGCRLYTQVNQKLHCYSCRATLFYRAIRH